MTHPVILCIFSWIIYTLLIHEHGFRAGVSNPAEESYRPADFISNPNQHLNELIKVFKAEVHFRQLCWSWTLQDGSSPGAGLEIPVLETVMHYKTVWHMELGFDLVLHYIL